MKRPIPYLHTWKQHVMALLIGLLLLLILISQISIKRTWSLYSQYSSAKNQITRATTASTELNQYQHQLAQLGPITNQGYNRELLLEKVTSFCREKNLLVNSFPEAQQIQENGTTIVSNQIEVQGAYKSMVELLYLLEQDEQLGVISSIRFYTHVERGRNRKQHLRGAITLRNLVL